MRMVADEAGVSTNAVSLALRNHPSIPERTRKRIRQIANTMGYRPNPLVSALMANIHSTRTKAESPVLGLIVEAESKELFEKVVFYQELFAGAVKRAEELGYRLDTFDVSPTDSEGKQVRRILTNRNIRGVILAPTFRPSGKIAIPLDGLAACGLGHSLREPAIHRVGTHNTSAVQLAWREAISRGYRRPGFMQQRYQLERAQIDKLGAFLALQAIHPEFADVPPLIYDRPCDDDEDYCFAQLIDWITQHKPDALIGLPWIQMKPLAEKFSIPRDLGVITFDSEPGWTVVKDAAEDIGVSAVDVLVAQIHRNENGVPPFPKTVLIESKWIEGATLTQRVAPNLFPGQC